MRRFVVGVWVAAAVLGGCGGPGGDTAPERSGGSRTDAPVREDAVSSRQGGDAPDRRGARGGDVVANPVPDVRAQDDAPGARDGAGREGEPDGGAVSDARGGDTTLAGLDVRDGMVGRADASSAGACSIEALGGLWVSTFAPYTGPCGACHNATVSPGQLKAPGPQWLMPGDAEGTVQRIESFGLLDPDEPLRSLLLLKPLARVDGGVKHTGGDLVFASTPAYDALVTFVHAAAPCVGSAP